MSKSVSKARILSGIIVYAEVCKSVQKHEYAYKNAHVQKRERNFSDLS